MTDSSLLSLSNLLKAATSKAPIRALGLAVVLGIPLALPIASHAEWHDPILQEVLSRSLDQPSSFDDPFEAEVWLVDMSTRLSRFIKDPALRLKVLKMIHFEASKVDLQPELVLALIQTESAFDQYAVSSAGAQGLMQIMPFWKDVIGRDKDNLITIETNLRYGCTILSYYLEKENGNLTRALARYNGSLGKTWYPERVLTNWERHWIVN
ncbi:lytic transglycosylase domain-containing protein [Endozoicomonas sp. SCSIO W0465]|uniref:lytic transglycosylase domain-containing protein n=1 Tax=Endozoicomonas sp. SCSIO W0465 TaxID=2918516 RepID=UPI002075CB21|nr:lytic transglycosylase domain-containing protein [Endozoicomonas sp. SCSIO W0465]USE34505.1 lytic transglycosylase domain-containing protein [Endozoicomonas sp. SCSIO W0465]